MNVLVLKINSLGRHFLFLSPPNAASRDALTMVKKDDASSGGVRTNNSETATATAGGSAIPTTVNTNTTTQSQSQSQSGFKKGQTPKGLASESSWSGGAQLDSKVSVAAGESAIQFRSQTLFSERPFEALIPVLVLLGVGSSVSAVTRRGRFLARVCKYAAVLITVLAARCVLL